MLNNTLNLVASYYDVATKDRIFLSINHDYFEPLTVQIQEDNQTLNTYLDELIYASTNISRSEHYMYNLLSVNKIENIISINYAVMLPNTVKTKDSIYTIKNNIAVLDPLVRKAIAYV